MPFSQSSSLLTYSISQLLTRLLTLDVLFIASIVHLVGFVCLTIHVSPRYDDDLQVSSLLQTALCPSSIVVSYATLQYLLDVSFRCLFPRLFTLKSTQLNLVACILAPLSTWIILHPPDNTTLYPWCRRPSDSISARRTVFVQNIQYKMYCQCQYFFFLAWLLAHAWYTRTANLASAFIRLSKLSGFDTCCNAVIS